MTRTIASTIVSEIANSVVRPVFLARFIFDSASLNLWSGYRQITVGGHVFVGVGELGSISPVVETQSIKARGLTFQLSGIDSSIIGTALTQEYQDRLCTLWLGFMDSTDALIDYLEIFKGRMDTMNIQESGETCDISIAAESVLITLERTNERRYTTEDQKLDYPNDAGFDQVPSLQTKEVNWGKT
jgi:hypothetical protein